MNFAIDLCVLNLKLLFFLLVVEGGTLLPRIPYEEGFHRLVVRIDQIGLKDAHIYLNPFFTVSVKGSLRAQLILLTNRFRVAVRLFRNRSQMTSKCGKNKKVAHEAQPILSLMFSPHFDVFCDLSLNRRTATWNLFVLFNKEAKVVNVDVIYASIL